MRPTYSKRSINSNLAEKSNPNAPEPHFNRLMVLRRLQLGATPGTREQRTTLKIEKQGPWHDEITRPVLMEEETVAAELQAAIDHHDDDRRFGGIHEGSSCVPQDRNAIRNESSGS